MEKPAHSAFETILRDELARGDLALGSVAPVLTHMLAISGGSLVNEAIVARLRGMLGHLATELLVAGGAEKLSAQFDQQAEALSDYLGADSAILSHCYALAVEWQLAQKLERKSSLDQVLTPLLQELIASESDVVAELAMAFLAAQSRFVQGQRRMEVSLTEFPAEMFHMVLDRWAAFPGIDDPEIAAKAVQALKSDYDESSSRLGLLARLVSAMRGGARAALELRHAGLALFATALSAMSKQPRELAVLSCYKQQNARLALGLRAAGLIESEIARQFELLHPEQNLPTGLDDVLPDRAQSLLTTSSTHLVR